jgi:hypothetical protein
MGSENFMDLLAGKSFSYNIFAFQRNNLNYTGDGVIVLTQSTLARATKSWEHSNQQ